MNNQCVVTGASSQIGDALLKLLPKLFFVVNAWSRQPQKEVSGVLWQFADLTEVYKIDESVSHLIHLAPLPLLTPVLELAMHPLRVIAISTCSVLHKAQSSSAAERKLAQEFLAAEEKAIAVARRKGHQLTLLRPTMLYGSGRDGTIGVLQSFALRYGFLVVPGTAQGLRQPVHVADVAQAVMLSLDEAKTIDKTYELGGKNQMTLRQMCEKILLDNGKRPRVIRLPLWPLKLAINTLRALKIRPEWDVALLQRARQNQVVDNRVAANDFGYAPRAFDGKSV